MTIDWILSTNITASLETYVLSRSWPYARSVVGFSSLLTLFQHAIRLLDIKDFQPSAVSPGTVTGSNAFPTFRHLIRLQGPTLRPNIVPRKRWISRIIRNVSGHARILSVAKNGRARHKRSISDITTQYSQPNKGPSRVIGLEEIIRICGKNLLHLPPEYAPSPLVVPTCVRATAHYLVENGMSLNI